jgi:hypothetical protein
MAAFSPDGSRLVTVGDHRTVRTWDASTGQPLCPPLKHAQTVFSPAFSPDGARLLTVNGNETRLWSVVGGQAISPPLRHADAGWMVAFSPDGTRVATASNDKTVTVWDLTGPEATDQDWLTLAELTSCSRLDETEARVPLTRQEWLTRWTDLTSRRPDLFLPPPTQALFDVEMARTPADAERLKMVGMWFRKRGQHESAVQLLTKARSAGATVGPLPLARSAWSAGRYDVAKREFATAIAAEPDVSKRSHLQKCLTAVGHEERGDWPKGGG